MEELGIEIIKLIKAIIVKLYKVLFRGMGL